MTAKTKRPKTAEAAISVPIVRYDGNEYTLQNEERLQVCIHRSLITDNGLTFDLQNRLLIPESLYCIWFGHARESSGVRRENIYGRSTRSIFLSSGIIGNRFSPSLSSSLPKRRLGSMASEKFVWEYLLRHGSTIRTPFANHARNARGGRLFSVSAVRP